MTRLLAAGFSIVGVLLTPAGSAAPIAGTCSQLVGSSHTSFVAAAECNSASGHAATAATGPTTSAPSPYISYEFKPLCPVNSADPTLVDTACSIGSGCPQDQMPGYLYGEPARGDFVRLEFQCRPLAAAATMTPATVATAFHRIPLPALRSRTQPGATTLVNLDTIFYVEAGPLDRTVTLLGQQVDLMIRPTSYRWDFGDGVRATTATPGSPYPSKDVVHRYLVAEDVTHRVTVVWSARWRVGRGSWQPVPGTVRTTGATTELRIVEAVPHLAGADTVSEGRAAPPRTRR